MKSLIRRGFALTAIAAASCATGLLTPAVAADNTPGYYIENYVRGSALTAFPDGQVFIRPQDVAPEQVWALTSPAGPTSVVDLSNGKCLTGTTLPNLPIIEAPCDDSDEQSFILINYSDGTLGFGGLYGCLSNRFDQAVSDICYVFRSQWRLVPAP